MGMETYSRLAIRILLWGCEKSVCKGEERHFAFFFLSSTSIFSYVCLFFRRRRTRRLIPIMHNDLSEYPLHDFLIEWDDSVDIDRKYIGAYITPYIPHPHCTVLVMYNLKPASILLVRCSLLGNEKKNGAQQTGKYFTYSNFACSHPKSPFRAFDL